MSSRKKQRFFQGINQTDRYIHPRRQSERNIFNSDNPTNYVIDLFGNDLTSDTDYFGSYTGVPKDERDSPLQDADDL